MFRQFVDRGRRVLPHGVLEQTGVLMWVTGVLLIGLRLTLMVPDQPVFRRMLQVGTTTLTGVAIVSGLIAALVAAIGLLAARWRSARARTAPEGGRGARRVVGRPAIPTPSQVIALAVDAFLAATVIRTALGWADTGSLSASWLALLVGVGALHLALVVLHDYRARPRRLK
jgi:hypothetical protein